MLNTISDIITEVLVRGQQSTTSGLITDDMLNDWLTEKHRTTAGYKPWPYTEGRASTTYASLVQDEDGDLRGEYFENWKPDSIRLLRIGGKRVRKMQFQQYMRHREDTPDNADKVFTDYGLIYKLNPNADLSGTITAWGQFTPYIDVTDSNALTVFSNRNEDGNEAIVEAMIGELKQRENKMEEAQAHMQKAMFILNTMWDKVKDEQHGYHGGEPGMFEYINILAGGLRDDVVRRDRWY